MNKKFDYILLPPDGFHETFEDLLSKSNKNFLDLENKLIELSKIQKKNLVVKYRSNIQRENFVCSSNYLVSYGNLLNLCHQNTKVIGPCGTSMIVLLKNKIEYYSYNFVKAYKKNRVLNNNFSLILHVADSADDVLINIKEKKIFKNEFSVDDLFFSNGFTLNQIIKKILVN